LEVGLGSKQSLLDHIERDAHLQALPIELLQPGPVVFRCLRASRANEP
jgi:hypothetical protein